MYYYYSSKTYDKFIGGETMSKANSILIIITLIAAIATVAISAYNPSIGASIALDSTQMAAMY